MAISAGLIVAGLNLVTEIIKRVWKLEKEGELSGVEKHSYVKLAATDFMKETGIVIDNLDGFINDLVELFNKYDLFTKGRQ